MDNGKQIIGSAILLLALICSSCSSKKHLPIISVASPISNAHAHNDYEHERPLYEALENGFTSIEIDVHSYRGKAVVCHDNKDLDTKPTIQDLYLEPLNKLVAQNDGVVFPNTKKQLILMVDLKKDKLILLDILGKLFVEYDHLIKSSLDAHEIWKPIQIVISGDPPLEKMLYDRTGYFYLDGRMHHLEDENIPAYLIPRISMSYRGNFTWLPDGNLPEEELSKMREIISAAHAKGKTFRFWGHPETEVFWKLLQREGVDWINVDQLEKFSKFTSSSKALD